MGKYIISNYGSGSILGRAAYGKITIDKTQKKHSILETKIFKQSLISKLVKKLEICRQVLKS